MSKKQFKTSNFYLSAYLLYKGMELVDIDRTNQKRAIFIFNDVPECEDLVRVFTFSKEVLVDARQFAMTLRELKSKLYAQ